METNLLEQITKLLEDKKAKNVNVIDTNGKTTLADYFVIASGTSSPHIKGLADHVEQELKKQGIYPYKVEGYTSGAWILMDYHDIVVNIFTEEQREHYNLDDLWAKAR